MKKYLLLCLMAGITMATSAESKDYEDYKLNISGEIEATVKSQDSVTTPFDYVDWGWGTRGGASDRDSQFSNIQGTVNFSSGTLGMSEYFGVVSFWFDPQSTNDNVELRNSQLGKTTWTNYESNKVEVTNAFAMWRPWAVKDTNGELLGRPLGITIGNQSIPATVNALSTHYFRGDKDGDFIGYTTTGLLNKPGVHIDFHTGEYGAGYAILKGSSDLLNNSAGFSNERSRTHVAYVDASTMGVDFTAAYQYTEGNRKTVDYESDVQDFFGNTDLGIDNDDYAYTGTAFNTSLAYTYQISENNSIKPFVGYQFTDTEVAPDIIVETANEVYGTDFNIQKVEETVTTIGAEYKTKLFGKNITFAAEISQFDTPDSEGLDLVYDGQIDYAVQSLISDSTTYTAALQAYDSYVAELTEAGYLAQGADSATAAAAGEAAKYAETAYSSMTYDMEDATFAGIAGEGNSTYTLVGLDRMAQVEMTIAMNENVDLTFFYKKAEAKDVDTEVTDEQKSDLAAGFVEMGYDSNAATALATSLADTIEDSLEEGTLWSDYDSVGMSVVYRF